MILVTLFILFLTETLRSLSLSKRISDKVSIDYLKVIALYNRDR